MALRRNPPSRFGSSELSQAIRPILLRRMGALLALSCAGEAMEAPRWRTPRKGSKLKITIDSRAPFFRDRLEPRLARARQLQCAMHGAAVQAVTITSCENGWFDSRLVACCEAMTGEASTIIGNRC